MLPNADKREGEAPSAAPNGQPILNVIGETKAAGDQSVFEQRLASAVIFPAATRLDLDIAGTVGASMNPAEARTYGSGSGLLLSDGPMGPAIRQPRAVPPGLRANLVVELREISEQVNRMMSQVDRAIHRLGEHAGKPLRR
jgi:hypothetical protein